MVDQLVLPHARADQKRFGKARGTGAWKTGNGINDAAATPWELRPERSSAEARRRPSRF
jgi:hypothetical protein